jgi:hypothetical protein
MLNFIKRSAVFVIVLSLAGCFIPEQFEATIQINSDGSYTYTYDGILAFAPALADAKRGRLDKRGEMEVAKLAPQMRRDGFQKADYLGKGRFSVSFRRTASKGHPSYFLSRDMQIFYIIPQTNDTIFIGAFRPDANTLRQLAEIGATVNGTLKVKVARGLTVVKHNAESKPWLGGMLGSYSWKIKSPNAQPYMVVRLSK